MTWTQLLAAGAVALGCSMILERAVIEGVKALRVVCIEIREVREQLEQARQEFRQARSFK